MRLWMCGISIATLIAGLVLSVEACDCKPAPEPTDAVKAAAAVMLGKAVKLEADPASGGWRVTLEVERWCKGGEAATVQVVTSKSGAACGYHFGVGNRYLVYAGGDAKQLFVSLCSRTRTAEQAEKSGDFKELGEGKKP